MTQKIVVAGHICLDIAPAFLNDKGCEITDLFCPGGLSEVGSADIHIGGSVANTGRVIPYVDFFLPSIEELAFMIDRQQYDSWKKSADGGDITSVLRLSEIEKLADRLLDWGANIVLIKCGAAGLYLAVGEEKRLKKTRIIKNVRQWADKRHFEYSYKPHGILSGTGAGGYKYRSISAGCYV